MRFVKLWAGLGLLAALAGGVRADEPSQFLGPFGDFAIREPAEHVAPNSPEFYGATGPRAGWQIAQWEIAGGKLPPFVGERRQGVEILTTESAEDLVRIRRTSSGETVHLHQDGAVLPCTRPNGGARESDLLIQPKDRREGHASALRTPPVRLDGLRSLMLETTVSVTAGMTRPRKGCGVNQGNAGVGLILNDLTTKPPQTLFYQLGFVQPCGPIPPARFRECVAGTKAPGFFFKKNPFGVDDRLPLVGQRFLSNGEHRTIRVELLPRLRELIAAGPGEMDRDPSHWVLGTIYAGQGIWGDYRMSSTWDALQVYSAAR